MSLEHIAVWWHTHHHRLHDAMMTILAEVHRPVLQHSHDCTKPDAPYFLHQTMTNKRIVVIIRTCFVSKLCVSKTCNTHLLIPQSSTIRRAWFLQKLSELHCQHFSLIFILQNVVQPKENKARRSFSLEWQLKEEQKLLPPPQKKYPLYILYAKVLSYRAHIQSLMANLNQVNVCLKDTAHF